MYQNEFTKLETYILFVFVHCHLDNTMECDPSIHTYSTQVIKTNHTILLSPEEMVQIRNEK